MLNTCFTITELRLTVVSDQNTKTEGCVFVLRTVMCDCSIDAKTLHVFVLRTVMCDCSIDAKTLHVFVLRTVMCDCSIDAKTLHVFVLRMFISDCSIRTPKQKLNVYHNNSYDCHAVAPELTGEQNDACLLKTSSDCQTVPGARLGRLSAGNQQ